MVTLSIPLDEETFELVREKARLAGQTPEEWAAEVVTRAVAPADQKEVIKQLLAAAGRVSGNSDGWKFNRDELYDRSYPGKFSKED